MLYKCKVCRGTLSLLDNATTAQCDYCRTIQTVPVANNQKKLNKFQRAYDHIADGDFDSAILRFEDIIDEGYDEAEAYWGLLLCKFGMRYDNAPGTDDRILTCHRLSFNSVEDDINYKEAITKADSASRILYEEEAERIESIRLRSIELSNNEDPYDVFICYKDKEEDGERTEDSVEAERIYDELEKKGLKVFFARRTLSQKLGIEFEPYIFAALNSAKVMLVVGTSYDHFTAPWVRNEWSRFLTIKKKKQVWIYPCYKNISDPQRDLPREFKSLESIDLSKVGAMQDLLRAIDGAVGNKTQFQKSSIVTEAPDKERFLTQAMNYLKAEQMGKAKTCFAKFIDDFPEDYRGWWGLVRVQTNNLAEIPYGQNDLVEDYKRALRFSPQHERSAIKAQLSGVAKKYILKDETNISRRETELNTLENDCQKATSKLSNVQQIKATAETTVNDNEQLSQNDANVHPRLRSFLNAVLWLTGIALTLGLIGFILDLYEGDSIPLEFVLKFFLYGGTIFLLGTLGIRYLNKFQKKKEEAQHIVELSKNEIASCENAIALLSHEIYGKEERIKALNAELNQLRIRKAWYCKLTEL